MNPGASITGVRPIVGMEIHVELGTRTKMFTRAPSPAHAQAGEPAPNSLIDPLVLALPGSLPVMNRVAVEMSIQVGLALGCQISSHSRWDRKSYFYPDLPKAYQISQYDEPVCLGGTFRYLTEDGEKSVGITRAHLEEDAAKLIHTGGDGRRAGAESSVVDFNRGGTPLVEIVTEPDLTSAAQAREWLTLLRTTLRQLGVSDVNMEEGSLRCDANVSVRPAGTEALGVKAELKNMNSFRFIEKGIEAEIARQIGLLEAGEPVVQETLHFDPVSGALTPLRSKEEAHDYRYFPEPDLVPVAPSRAWVEELRGSLPEPPREHRARLQAEWGFNRETVSGSQVEWVHPTLLVKYGFRRWELRLETCTRSLGRSSGSSGKQVALEPVELGFKLALLEEKNWLPQTSLIVHLAVPQLASRIYRSQTWVPSARLAMQHGLTNNLGLGCNLGVNFDQPQARAADAALENVGVDGLDERTLAHAARAPEQRVVGRQAGRESLGVLGEDVAHPVDALQQRKFHAIHARHGNQPAGAGCAGQIVLPQALRFAILARN